MTNSHLFLLFVVTLVVCLTQFATDIYAPSIPVISSDFKTTIDLVQWSMAIYLLGVALSQLIYGPLSDGIGRKIPLLIGLFIMIIGSLLCLFAQNVHTLTWGRLIQGCGAGACAALWRPIFRDLFQGEDLAKYGSYLVIFITFIVPAAPALGAYLQEIANWRANFLFIAIYTLIAFLSTWLFFKETSQHHHLDRLKPKHIFKIYGSLLKSPLFMGITICTFFSYGAFFGWFVAGPVLLIQGLKMSPLSFGWITFIGGGAAYALAGWLNGRCVKSFGIPAMMRFGWSVMIFSGALMLVGYLIAGVNIFAIVIPALLFYFGSTFIWPNAFATAFTPFGHIAGYAGALYGFMTLGGGAALGGLISWLPETNQFPLSLVMVGASLLSWLIYEVMVNKNPKGT